MVFLPRVIPFCILLQGDFPLKICFELSHSWLISSPLNSIYINLASRSIHSHPLTYLSSFSSWKFPSCTSALTWISQHFQAWHTLNDSDFARVIPAMCSAFLPIFMPISSCSFFKTQIKYHFFIKTSKLSLSKAILRTFDAFYWHHKEYIC